MAVFLSNGSVTGGSTTVYTPGTQGVQTLHDFFAINGDTIQLPNGTFMWSSSVSFTKAITFTSQNFQQATVGPGNLGANSIMLSVQKSANVAYTNNSKNASVRITGINFASTTSTNAAKFINVTDIGGSYTSSASSIYTPSTNPALIDNNTFLCGPTLSGSTQCGAIRCSTNGVVVSKNTFTNTNTGGATTGHVGFDAGGIECIFGAALDPSWQSFDTMGANDTTGYCNIYVETNTFNGLLDQAVDHSDNSRVVVRNNTFNDTAIASHGQDSGNSGGRHYEIYNNTWVHNTSGSIPYSSPADTYPIPLDYWILYRAATGVITGNTIPDNSTSAWGTKQSISLGIFNICTQAGFLNTCQTTYPAARQIGQTWIGTVSGFSPHRFNGDTSQAGATTAVDGPTDAQFASGQGYFTDPLYVWNNTPVGGFWSALQTRDQSTGTCPAFTSWVFNHPSGPTFASQFITSGTDVKYVQKTSGPTGAWTAYQYPHPLVASNPVSPSLSGQLGVTAVINPGISASGVTAATEAAIVRTIVGATGGGYAIPANNWVSLYSTQFSSAKAGATEWIGGSYARQPMGASAAGWTIAAYSNGIGVVWSNANLINFPAVLTSQTLFSLGFCDALTSGNIDFFIDLLLTITVPVGINVTLPASTGAVFTTY